MRTVVLAYTHIHMLEHPPAKIINALSAVDLIIHAADFTDVKTLLPVKEIIEVENTLIGTTMDQAVLGEYKGEQGRRLNQIRLTLLSIAILTDPKTKLSMLLFSSTSAKPQTFSAFSRLAGRLTEK